MADGSNGCGDVKTALYRHFDADGRLLYVGISLSPTYRLRQHHDCSAWFQSIANVTVEWFPDRSAAMAAERQAIKAESPEFNVVHKFTAKDALREKAEESCAELTRKVTRFSASYRAAQAAVVVGIPSSHMKLALAAGDLPYYTTPRHVAITGWALIGYLEALQAGAAQVRRPLRNEDGSLRRAPTEAWLIEHHCRASIEAWYEFESVLTQEAAEAQKADADELADRL